MEGRTHSKYSICKERLNGGKQEVGAAGHEGHRPRACPPSFFVVGDGRPGAEAGQGRGLTISSVPPTIAATQLGREVTVTETFWRGAVCSPGPSW